MVARRDAHYCVDTGVSGSVTIGWLHGTGVFMFSLPFGMFRDRFRSDSKETAHLVQGELLQWVIGFFRGISQECMWVLK